MACCCNSTPCSCSPAPVTCCTPTTESVEYTFENANAAGIGVFDNDTDNLVQFRGIVSDSASLTVTLNAVDNTIVLDFDDAALVADIPDATTTQRGILETATNAEALAKAATDKIVTPSNFAAMGSTTTFAGLVELATDAETIAGVSTTLAVTPAGLAAASSLYGTTTFADAVDRSGTTPTFAGQFGTQLDTGAGYVSSSTVMGAWLPMFTLGVINDSPGANTTILNLNGDTFSFVGGGGLVDFGADAIFTESVTLGDGAGSTLDFDNPTIKVAGATITDSVFCTDNTGLPNPILIAAFLSSANVQTGWGTPSSTLARTTFATYAGAVITNPPTQAEVQAINDALVIVSQRLGALITDLKAVLLPAT